MRSAIDGFPAPAERLAAIVDRYVRFAAANRALFAVLYEAGLDKTRYPEIEAAERPVADALLGCVRALADGSNGQADDLATAVEATARGFALMLLDGEFGAGEQAIERAAMQAARVTTALIDGRHLLAGPRPSR